MKRATKHRGRTYEAVHCKFWHDGSGLWAELPSGRRLFYANMRIGAATRKGWEGSETLIYDSAPKGRLVTHDTYGGKIIENLVQAIARDLLADMLVRCETSGYPLALHVHDELVTEVREEQSDEIMAFLTKQMAIPPVWGRGIPVFSGPEIMRRYGK